MREKFATSAFRVDGVFMFHSTGRSDSHLRTGSPELKLRLLLSALAGVHEIYVSSRQKFYGFMQLPSDAYPSINAERQSAGLLGQKFMIMLRVNRTLLVS